MHLYVYNELFQSLVIYIYLEDFLKTSQLNICRNQKAQISLDTFQDNLKFETNNIKMHLK